MLRQKKHLEYSMWRCVITSIIHTNTEYVTSNSDNVLCLVKYSEIVDTINLVTMTHTIHCIAQVYFKQYQMGIEDVHTTALIRKKLK